MRRVEPCLQRVEFRLHLLIMRDQPVIMEAEVRVDKLGVLKGGLNLCGINQPILKCALPISDRGRLVGERNNLESSEAYLFRSSGR